MKPTDETIYNGMNAENEVGNFEAPQTGETDSKKEAWKLVSLGGVSGILMGAGSIYAINAMAANDEDNPSKPEEDTPKHDDPATDNPEPGLQVADVTPGKTFSQAFAEARDEVGPGGVFHWRGGIYNTYLKEEWDAMSREEKNEFAERVKPEYGVDKIDTKQITELHPQVVIKDETKMDKDMAENHKVEQGDTDNRQGIHDNDQRREGDVNDDNHDKEKDVHDDHLDNDETLNNSHENNQEDNKTEIDDSGDKLKFNFEGGDDVYLISEDTNEMMTINGKSARVIGDTLELSDGQTVSTADIVFADLDQHDLALRDFNNNKVIEDGEILDTTDLKVLNTDGSEYAGKNRFQNGLSQRELAEYFSNLDNDDSSSSDTYDSSNKDDDDYDSSDTYYGTSYNYDEDMSEADAFFQLLEELGSDEDYDGDF